MHIILVLGIRLLRSGKLEDKFIASIRKGVELMDFYRGNSLLVISGGVTRPPFPSEAKAALAYIPEGLHSEILLEEKAETTRQNVQNVRKLVADVPFHLIHVVGSPGHVARADELFKTEWPKGHACFIPEFVGAKNFWDDLAHGILRIPMKLDPQEKVLLPLRRLLIRWKLS